MKLLIDINVVLDVILARKPWDREAAELLSRVDGGEAEGYVAGHTITTVHYVVSKVVGRARATTAVADLLRIVDVVPVGKDEILQALALGLTDFKDAIQAACALKVGADFVVTRNVRDFQGLAIPAQPPGAVLPLL